MFNSVVAVFFYPSLVDLEDSSVESLHVGALVDGGNNFDFETVVGDFDSCLYISTSLQRLTNTS